MDDIFLALLLLCLALLIAGLFAPRIALCATRGQALARYGLGAIMMFVAFGLASDQAAATAPSGVAPTTAAAHVPMQPPAAPADPAPGPVPSAEPEDAPRLAPASGMAPGSAVHLVSDLGTVFVSSSSEWWDDAHSVAELANGTPAVLLARITFPDTPGLWRCKIRTRGARRITGWVMCGDVQ